ATSVRAGSALRPDRPSPGDGEARSDHRTEKSIPASTGGSLPVAFGLRLLEGVADRDREPRVRLLDETTHRVRHAFEEERLRLDLTPVPVWRGDQLLGLGHGESREEIGEDRLQRAAQPDVEEVRKISVTDIVIVRRICKDKTSAKGRNT